MELYQLKAFIEVARRRNLTRAAAHMHISPSALSTRIQSLETGLGVVLFTRGARGMHLTDAGRDLLAEARKVVKAAEQMKKRALELGPKRPDILKIGMNADPQFLRMSRLNEALGSALPKVTIRYVGSSTLETTRMLRNRLIDIGFMYDTPIPADIRMEFLTRVRYQAVIPEALVSGLKTLDWPALAQLPWIWGDARCPSHAAFQKQINHANRDINTLSYTVDEKITKQLVRDGKGVALIREDEAREFANSGLARIWKPGTVWVTFGMACLAERGERFPIKTACEVIRRLWELS